MQSSSRNSGGAVAVLAPRSELMQSVSPRIGAAVRIGTQLALLALVIRQFDIESSAFLQICLLAFGGSLVHGFLPLAWRLPFFAGLSIAGIGLVFGFWQSLWLLGFGSALLGICHLPMRFAARVGLLLLAGAALAVLRAGWIDGPWSPAIWPILGSMFMFRLIVYVYDLRHETGPRSFSRTMAYLFMLPNVCFPMFPVVDYKTFKRTYYNDDEDRIRQVGVEWIFRGVLQLILYRVVYYYLTMSPADVTSPADLGRFMVANYLLYLRISGQFHVVVGILRLFGFNLPETHHRYLLATGINDFWRRINIYWKDFMMKIFYYPSFFALKKRGWTERWSLVLATMVVFVSTWLLHSYQWFWLRGSFPLTWPDALFWGILGVLVVGNTLYEADKGRTRRLGNRSWSPSQMGGVALRTALTFCFICALWSLWTAESISAWFMLWRNAFSTGVSAQTLNTLSVGAVAVAVGTASGGGATPRGPRSGYRASVVTAVAIGALYFAGLPQIYTRLDARMGNVIEALRAQKLNTQDAAMLERGYYENLLSVERFNSQLWELYSKRPAGDGNLRDSGGMRQTSDFIVEELIPSIDIMFKGVPFRTNHWGMRDTEHERSKPDGTYRFAILGPSDAMGTGVLAEQTFASLLEEQLNQQHQSGYEVLNFATSNYTPLQYLWLLEHRAMQFTPDAVIVVGHDDDAQRTTRHLASVVSRRIPVPYEPLRQIVQRAELTPRMTEAEMRRRLRPFTDEIVGWTYQRIAEECREREIIPIWLYLPFLVEDVKGADASLLKHAANAGFVVLDYSDLYRGRDIRSLRVAEWDQHHPNVPGHTMIADRLYQDIQASPYAGRLGLQDR
jgi:D-alanyl-lipoteichoic acid acyltransferase DltB (MBOAT superfamily)